MGQGNSCPLEPGATMAGHSRAHGQEAGMGWAGGMCLWMQQPGSTWLLVCPQERRHCCGRLWCPCRWPQEPMEEAMSCVWPWCPHRRPQPAAIGRPQITRQQLCHQLVGSSLWEDTVGPGAEGSPLLRERLVKRKEKPGRTMELLLQQELGSQTATPLGSASSSASAHGRQGHTAALGTWSTELSLGIEGTGNDVQDGSTCNRTTVQHGILGH